MAIGGLVVLALLGVLIAPFFIDWTAYRADFEREASRIIGQRVVVRGDASARLLPFPSVTFTDVEVEGEPGERPLLTVGHFRMDAELAPYLSGELKIFSMRIEDPVLDLRIGADGRAAFLPKGGALPTRATVVLENVTVANGRIAITDAGSTKRYELTDIEGTFAAQSLAGPISGGGELKAEGRPLAFQLSTGQTDGEAHLPTRLTLEDTAAAVSATLDGRTAIADGAPRFEGTLRAASTTAPTRPDGDAKGDRPRATQGALPRFALTGKLAAGTRGLDVTDLRLNVGPGPKPYVLTGSAKLTGGAAPAFLIALDGEQIDIDAIANGAGSHATATLEKRLAAARRLLERVPKPPLPGSVKLTLPVVAAGDTTIRDLAVEASPAGESWTIRRFEAELPGRTRMEASGVLDLAGEARFVGSLLVAARQPSGFSEWLTGAVDPAVRALPGAGFSATVDLSAARQSFRDLELDVGGDRLKGTLERSGAPSARAIDAALEGGRVDLDALIALSRIFTGEEDSIADARRGRLKLAAGPVAYGGATADRVDTDLSFDGRTLTIARGEVRGLAGGDITAKGTLTGFDADPSGSIEATLVADEPSELVDFLSRKLPHSPALDALQAQAPKLGPLRLSGTIRTTAGASGERPTLDVDVKGTAARTDVSLRATLGNGIYAGGKVGRFGADAQLSSADPAGLLGQLGLEALPIGTPSPLTVSLSLAADATGPVAARAAMRAPGSELTADGTLAVSGTGFESGRFALAGRSDDFTPWLLATGNGFGASAADALPVGFGGTLAFEGAKLRLDDLEGSVGAVDLSANLERDGDGPVTGAAFFSQLSVPWLASLVAGGAATASDRPAEWSKAGFGAPLIGDARLAIDVTTDRLDLGGDAAAGEVFAHLTTSPGEIALADMRGTLGGGYATGSLSLRNADGVGAVSLGADMQGLDLGRLSRHGFAPPSEDEDDGAPAAPPGVTGLLDATIKLDGSGQSYAGLLSAMTGAGRLRFESVKLGGLAPGLLAKALAAADAKGFEATLPAVSSLVADAARDAEYPIASAATEFSIIGGVARFPAVVVERSGEKLTAEGAVRLADLGLSGTLRLDLDPGDDAVAGAAPAVQYALGGTLPRPVLDADVQALANYLSVRALEREQARVEAIQAALQEKLRLRREARLYRWRERQRAAAEAAAATAEGVRLDRNRREDAAKRESEREAAREAAEAADAERRAQAEAAAAAERTRSQRAAERARAAQSPEEAAPRLDFGPLPAPPEAPTPPPADPNLPGVQNPLKF